MTTLKTAAKETNLFTVDVDVTSRLHACMQKIVYLEERMYFINQLRCTLTSLIARQKKQHMLYVNQGPEHLLF